MVTDNDGHDDDDNDVGYYDGDGDYDDRGNDELLTIMVMMQT